LEILPARRGADSVVLDNISVNVGSVNTGAGTLHLSFSTLFVNNTLLPALGCFRSNPAGLTAVVENNILLTTTSDAISGGNCLTEHNVLFPQIASVAGTNIITNPLLVDPISHDLHPTTTSPAVDAAVPGQLLSEHDVNGTPRPQHSRSDIGAFELN
jgi:hypothetical protein